MKYIIAVSLLSMFTNPKILGTDADLSGPYVCNTNNRKIEENSDGDFVFPTFFKECCAGYIKNDNGDQCIPFCTECKYGECIATEKCRCYAGYEGPSCDHSCSEGYWGHNCAKRCDCLNETACDPKTGACAVCPEVYSGPDCSIRNPKPQEQIWTLPYLAAVILCVITTIFVSVIVGTFVWYLKRNRDPKTSTVALKRINTSSNSDQTTERPCHNLYTPLDCQVSSKLTNTGRSNIDDSPKDVCIKTSSPTAAVYIDMRNPNGELVDKSYDNPFFEENLYDEILYVNGSDEKDKYDRLNYLGASSSIPTEGYDLINNTHNNVHNKTKGKSLGDK